MLKKTALTVAMLGIYAPDAAAPIQDNSATLASLIKPRLELVTPLEKMPLSKRTTVEITELVRYTIAKECPDGFRYKAGFKKINKTVEPG